MNLEQMLVKIFLISGLDSATFTFSDKNLGAARRRLTNPRSSKTHCCAGAGTRATTNSPQDEAPAGPRPPQFREPHWPAFRPPSLSAHGVRLGKGTSPLSGIDWSNLHDGEGFPSVYWFLGFKMGGERQSDRAQGRQRGVRRRVVGDARPRYLLGNLVLSPRPLGAFCPVNCRSGGGSSAGRHAGALQGAERIPEKLSVEKVVFVRVL